MPRLLINNDYEKYIQEKNILQVIEDNWVLAQDVEQAAQDEMKGWLRQRYDVTKIFTNTTTFVLANVYNSKDLVFLTATEFSATASYVINQLVLYLGNVYYANGAIAPAAWNASNFTLIGAEGFYYVDLPTGVLEYDSETVNEINDVVWYNDHTYTCLARNTGVLPTTAAYWTDGGEYTITNKYPVIDDEWIAGDNRNQLIVMRLIDITLFHLHSRINPRNVPDLRKERYDGNSPAQIGGAIGWLKQIAKGEVSVDVAEIAPEQNLSINFGNSGGDQSNTFYPNTY